MKTNRHPVDDLAELRARINALQERADELRHAIIEGRCSLVGDQNEARVRRHVTQRVNQAAIVRELGAERLRPFMTSTEVVSVLVSER
jgi:hypothetical protein